MAMNISALAIIAEKRVACFETELFGDSDIAHIVYLHYKSMDSCKTKPFSCAPKQFSFQIIELNDVL